VTIPKKMTMTTSTSPFICWSRDEPEFVVIAYQSEEKGYEVKHALVRDMDTDDTWNGIIPGGKLFVPN